VDAEGHEALVRRSVDGWNAEDWEEELSRVWNPDGLIISPEGWPESGTFKGWNEMVEQWRRIKGSWAEERVELTESQSVGDRVLAHFRWIMRGDASGAPVEGDMWGVYEFGEGRIVKLVYFQDANAARRAAEEGP
jgi:hypothetical protein